MPIPGRLSQKLVGEVGFDVLRAVKAGIMATDDFLSGVSLGALGTGVPTRNNSIRIEHEYRVVLDLLDHQPKSSLVCGKFHRALLDALLERFIEVAQPGFGLMLAGDIALVGLPTPGWS